jgi:O-antigen/teichoic acid export membrane protein
MIPRLRTYLSRDGLGPTLVRAVVGSAGIRILGMGFGFLVGVQLARGLGASGYGVYGLAMSIISMIGIPTEFGLPQLVTREVAAAQARNNWSLIRGILRWANRTVLILSFCMTGAGLLGWLMFKDQFNDGVAMALLAGIALVPLVALGNLRGAALRGLQQIVRGQLPEVVFRPAVFSLLLLLASILIPTGLSPAIAMAMQALAAAVTLAVAAYMLRGLLQPTPSAASPATDAKGWLRSAWPMALTEGMRMLHGNLSILLLGALSTSAVVGVFRVSTSIGLILAMSVSLLHVVISPVISRLYASDDKERLQRVLSWVATFSVLGVAVTTLPFILFGSQILTLVFGSDFASANVPLLVLSGGSMVGSMFGAGVIVLNMTGHEKRVTRAFGLSLLALGALLPPCIYWGGVVGAALANSFAYILWSVLMWLDARRFLKLDTSVFSLIRVLCVLREQQHAG